MQEKKQIDLRMAEAERRQEAYSPPPGLRRDVWVDLEVRVPREPGVERRSYLGICCGASDGSGWWCSIELTRVGAGVNDGIAWAEKGEAHGLRLQVGGSSVKLSPRALLGLYRGILPPLLSTGAIRSLYFGIYEALRPRCSQALALPEDDTRTVFMAGAATGMLTAPVTAPMGCFSLLTSL